MYTELYWTSKIILNTLIRVLNGRKPPLKLEAPGSSKLVYDQPRRPLRSAVAAAVGVQTGYRSKKLILERRPLESTVAVSRASEAKNPPGLVACLCSLSKIARNVDK